MINGERACPEHHAVQGLINQAPTMNIKNKSLNLGLFNPS